MSAAPPGWVSLALADVVSLKTGPFGSALHKSDYVTGGIPLINPSHIRNGRLDPDPNVSIDGAARTRLSEYCLQEDDVVMGRRGEMGRCAVVLTAASGWLCGTGSVIVRPGPAIRAPFLQRFLSAPTTVETLNGDSVGSTMVNLNQGVLLGLHIELPPLAEQQRIADKLDTVLTRVDACRDRLARVAPLLKRFRQSVLAAATSGKLTGDWRANGGSTSWREATIEEVCQSVADGDHQAPPQSDSGVPFITIAAMNDGRLNLQKSTRYVPRSYFDGLSDKRRPQRGDVLYSVTASLGIPAIVDVDVAFAFQRHIAILRPHLMTIFSEYLYYVLSSEHVRQQALAAATGTAQLTLALGSLRSISIGLPEPIEQTEIIRRVDTLFAFADRLQARLTQAQTAVDRLTPSLLAKAFRGELVPQDPADEPAADLLKRLAASRTAPAPKTRKPRQSQTA